MSLAFNEFSEKNARRCKECWHEVTAWNAVQWSNAIAGETGELCNLTKKEQRGDTIPTVEMLHEIADIVIYADLLCTRLGFKLGDIVAEKFNIVSQRVGSNIAL